MTERSLALTALFAASFLLVGCAGTRASTQAPPVLLDARGVDPLFADYASPGSPGASVVVIHEGA
ncbi:MAG TPA: hypothetical protein VGB96_00080, partial [Archangium sp.]